jgi:orotate phosphoribosyltransferase
MAKNLELQNEARRTLFLEYARAGLILFGRFQAENGNFWPLSFHLTLLPSFPKLMKMTAELLMPLCPPMSERDRLLTTRNTTALGGVLATLTDIPMLYPYGEIKSYTAAFAIEGAADVGHPTTLLTDVLLDGALELQVTERAAQVGIPVKRIVALVDARQRENHQFERRGIREIQSLFPLQESVQWITEAGLITNHLAQRIFDWQTTLP